MSKRDKELLGVLNSFRAKQGEKSLSASEVTGKNLELLIMEYLPV